jgi:hypothetical protein
MKNTLAILLAVGLLFGMGAAADAYTILGTGTAALLDGDLTDPEGDGVDNPETATGNGLFNANFYASSEPTFSSVGGGPNEAAFDVFDNKVGGGEAKWCCGGPTQWVAAEFDKPYALTHFTLTSSNDSPGRDADVWAIQGSNDSTNGADGTWTDIYLFSNNDPFASNNRNDGDTSPFTARNQVLLFESPAGPNSPLPGSADFAAKLGTGYEWFRYHATSSSGWGGGGGEHALGELELFGVVVPEPTTLLVWSLLAGLGVGLGWRRRK